MKSAWQQRGAGRRGGRRGLVTSWLEYYQQAHTHTNKLRAGGRERARVRATLELNALRVASTRHVSFVIYD